MRRFHISAFLAAALAACLTLTAAPAPAGVVGFEEDFALAPDRDAVLKQLIPGTPEHYFYTCLHLQNQGKLDEADKVLAEWIKRHNESAKTVEIQNRQALLRYEKDPRKSLDFLIWRLGIQFNHQKENLAQQRTFVSVLPQNLISRDTLKARALSNYSDTLNGFENSALDWLITTELSGPRLHELLSRLQRPDYPNLVKLVNDDLNGRWNTGFGSLNIHRLMLLAQLDELVKLRPTLLNEQNFVNIYLTKLQPSADADIAHDPKEKKSHLERMWAFVGALGPVHNSLKAHVLYQRLVFDRTQGEWNKERFDTYIKLPRPVHYVRQEWLERDDNRNVQVVLNADFKAVTLCPPINADEPLIRSYFLQFFKEAESFDDYKPYIHDYYLKQLFAEAKIVNNIGEQEKWYALLTPEQHKALKERVDVDFAFTNKPVYGVNDPVALDLFVKNVPTLLVKVYEVNALSYYKSQLREIDTDINLDGLVANVERVEKYEDAPLRRVPRKFEFKEINKPGVYVVDFIGGGVSSRAVIRKGGLRYVERVGSAGHVLTILDHAHKPVKGASVYVAGHEYTAEKESSEITIPFSAQPGGQQIVLYAGDVASIDTFNHQAENYELVAGFHVDREAMLRYAKAKVVIRPSLRVNGNPISLKLVEQAVLTITSVDREGVQTSKEVTDFKLADEKDAVYEFAVPDKLSSINFVLRGKVQNLSRNKKEDVGVGASFNLNDIDKTDKIEDLHLARYGGEYVVELLGKTGETKAKRPVQFQFKHRDFREVVYATLMTDDAGRCRLGALDDIVSITATSPDGISHAWQPTKDLATLPGAAHGVAGKAIRLPYVGKAKEATPAEFSLLEMRGGTYYADRSKSLAIQDGYLVVQDLPAGDYSLFIKSTGETVNVRLTAGESRDGWVLGENRQLEIPDIAPLHITSVNANADNVVIQLGNATKSARVHVVATRYVPKFPLYYALGNVRWPGARGVGLGKLENLYLAGRNIGDEYRYILDRKYAEQLPGNMLPRPGLLLNPWAIRKTETGQQVAQLGDVYRATGAANAPRQAMQDQAANEESKFKATFYGAGKGSGGADNFTSLDFLATTSVVLTNLRPDAKGVITIDRKQLGAHQEIHVIAVDDAGTIYREVSLPEVVAKPRDLRLLASLDVEKHFSEKQEITLLNKGQTFSIIDAGTSSMEVYDNLPRLYRLYSTLNPSNDLAEFNFILRWPSLKPEEKREKYSKYACHELNFFLFKKDPEFFKAVVQPYLNNKKDKTFMDHVLIGADLKGYMEPWQYGQLNMAERALLGTRIQGEAAKTARHLKDRYDLLPRDIERFNFLFRTAIKSSSLEAESAYGFAGEKAALGATITPLQEQAKGGSGRAAGPVTAAAPAPPPAARDGANKNAEMVEKLDDLVADKMGDEASEMELAKAQEKPKESSGKTLRAAKDRSDLKRREAQRQLYQKLDLTQEWAENNYYHLPIEQQSAALIPASALWRDYAQYLEPKPGAAGDQPFLSQNLAEGHRNFTEIMLALALIDLPFEAGKHETKQKDAEFTITAASPMVIFHKAIKEAKQAAEKTPILVSQNYFRLSDRYTMVDNERIDKYVTDEFLVHVVYGCQVVITNPTSSRQKLDILLQVPKGAIPVLNAQYTRGLHVELEPYQARAIEYQFYFPLAGEFPHYPAHVARNEELIAFCPATTLKAVEKLSKVDTKSWDYVSQYGTADETIDFLKANNADRLNLDKIAWRMQDAEFFGRAISLLVERHIFQATLWSYGLKHNKLEAARQYLLHRDDFINQCGPYIESKLVSIDPVIRKSYQHLEYAPLVNARAHKLGKARQIVNERMFQQYERLLTVLAYRPKLDDDDKMALTYYLLLQDRVTEAKAFFAKVDARKLATGLQHDYFSTVLAFYNADATPARAISAKYKEYPVDRWRNLFAVVTTQLDELDGKAGDVIDKDDRDQQQAKLAATEPSFEFKAEARKITIDYQNLEQVTVNYYLMDLELLFSQNPFIQTDGGQFAYIRPNESAVVKLDKAKKTLTFDLPEKFHANNVMIEITGAGRTQARAYYANTMAVNVVENYGQLKVASDKTGKPLPKTYVKVYARMKNGGVAFYKDGYTDLRGRFDYTSLNTNEIDNVDRFAILIVSATDGAVVREAAPPKR